MLVCLDFAVALGAEMIVNVALPLSDPVAGVVFPPKELEIVMTLCFVEFDNSAVVVDASEGNAGYLL